MKFDIKNYDINFDSVFLKKDVETEFQTFLQQEQNEESFLCLKEILNIENTKEAIDTIDTIKTIIKTYLSEDSDLEVNISGKTKKEFLTKISQQLEQKDKWILEETPSELLSDIKRCLIANLATDSFPRFIRLQTIENLFSKYHEDTSVMIPRTVIQFPYKNCDFEDLIIDDNCIHFAEILAKDTYDWEILYSNKSPLCKIYQSKVNFLPFSSFFHGCCAYKLETVVPLCIETLSCACLTWSKRVIDSDIKRIDEVYSTDFLKKTYPDRPMKHDRISAKHEILLENLFPIDNRRMSFIETIDYNHDEKSIIYVQKSYIPKEYHSDENIDWAKHVEYQSIKSNDKKIKGYIIPSFMYIYLQKIDDNTTKLHHIKSKII